MVLRLYRTVLSRYVLKYLRAKHGHDGYNLLSKEREGRGWKGA